MGVRSQAKPKAFQFAHFNNVSSSRFWLSADGRHVRCLMVLDPRRGDVEPDAVAANAGCAALLCESFVDLDDSLAFGTDGESFADRADVHVFEVAEYSAGFEELEAGGDEFVHECCGEVVEGESGDDEVKGCGGLEVLEGHLVDRSLVMVTGPDGFGLEALFEKGDEIGVEFDQVELIVGLEELEDAIGYWTGSGANFEDVYRLLRVSGCQKAGHCFGKKAAAGGDGACGFEAFSEL